MSTVPLVQIREASTLERAGWDDLVDRFDNHRVTHKTAWLRSLQASALGKPLHIVFERDGDVVGCLPGLVAGFGPLRLFGSPMPGWQTVGMGPAFDPGRISTREMMGALAPFLEREHGVHHIELITPDVDGETMRALGFRGEQMVTYRAPLYPDDEARALRGMKDSARRNVRRGERLGLSVRFEDGDDFVSEHYAQIEEVFARGGNIVPFRRRRLAEFVGHMREAGHLVAAAVYLPDGGPCVATGTFTIEGRELVLWMWAHRTRHRWYRATELMTWAVMRRAMAAGCTSVDFMGRGDFKAVFGAVPDARKYRWVRSRLGALTYARDLAQRGFRWQQGIRGRLARMQLERRESLAGADSADADGASRGRGTLGSPHDVLARTILLAGGIANAL